MASSISLKSRSSTSLRKPQFLITPFTPTCVDNGILTMRYEEALLSKPPIAVTISPPIQPPTDVHPAFRTSCERIKEDERKRDSGLPNPTSNRCSEGLTFDASSSSSIKLTPSQVKEHLGTRINLNSSSLGTIQSSTSGMGSSHMTLPAHTEKSGEEWQSNTHSELGKCSNSCSQDEFTGIQTKISTEQLIENNFLEQMTFSNRGSMIYEGHNDGETTTRYSDVIREYAHSRLTEMTDLSADTERESQNIRSMYENNLDLVHMKNNKNSQLYKDDLSSSFGHKKTGSCDKVTLGLLTPQTRPSSRKEYELAGGIEDWEDINGCDVDRYGFIKKSNKSRSQTPDLTVSQRTSMILQISTDTSIRKRGINRISSVIPSIPKKSIQTVSMNATYPNSLSLSLKAIAPDKRDRATSNRYKKLIDGAGEILNSPGGLSNLSGEEEKIAENLKIKEWKRAEKWRKMAKTQIPSAGGDGMKYEFDLSSTKLIRRTWKGIPDRWRAAAWYSFLRTSAKRQKKSFSETEITKDFHKLLRENSADDVQIDLDVPRTINSHIMFRKRYRGGQRLLFRLLHCLSLYFPRIGYVQGMASLAATLLCYFDEEQAFIMLVRLWTLRGMDKLYDPGFQGLMSALKEFQTQWINNKAVSKKLEYLNIEPTAYGTRWYLTLFNFSIPFSTQLRVWDVFMLLGDVDLSSPSPTKPFGGGLNIIHATSAALIDANKDIILASDFENAMEALTSWIPVKDDELLMKVARAEWKSHKYNTKYTYPSN